MSTSLKPCKPQYNQVQTGGHACVAQSTSWSPYQAQLVLSRHCLLVALARGWMGRAGKLEQWLIDGCQKRHLHPAACAGVACSRDPVMMQRVDSGSGGGYSYGEQPRVRPELSLGVLHCITFLSLYTCFNTNRGLLYWTRGRH